MAVLVLLSVASNFTAAASPALSASSGQPSQALLSGTTPPAPHSTIPGSSSFAADRVLVKFRPSVHATIGSSGVLASGRRSLDQKLAQTGIRNAASLIRGSASRPGNPVAAGSDRFGLGRIYRVQLRSGQDVRAAVAILAADPEIEYAEPDYQATASDATPRAYAFWEMSALLE
jgi:hypothetical protein